LRSVDDKGDGFVYWLCKTGCATKS